MKKMCLKKLWAVVLLLTICLLPACGTKGDFYYAIRCAHVAFPTFYDFLQGDPTGYHFYEKDSYGRILFSVKGKGETGTALVILQKYDEKYVYYIEDYCYLIGEGTEEYLEKLKERNDWNKDYDDSRICRRRTTGGFEKDSKRIFPDVYEVLEITEEQVITRWLLGEFDENGNELYYFIIEKDGERSHALVICDVEYQVSYQQFAPESYPSPEEIRKFKSEHGWVYDTIEYL